MEKTRFETGMENLKKIDGEGGEAVIRSLENISPDLGKYIVEFAFGDIYDRGGLSLQEREMITLASLLTAGGCEPQLEVHIRGALNVGISSEKIIEVFLQCIPYTGFPKVLNAVFAAKDIITQPLMV
ncbi:MAG: carboxymuconolactone decarboxylase family protein [Lachnospiraceae bacterium]|nr:carboxymuconolactone decarboxylase family protein [Lachnospiraceae bacterium]